METSGDPDITEPDLAQLLVLEAGRILEDLAPELALRLPGPTSYCHDMIAVMIKRIDRARSLLVAASKI